MNIGKYRNNLAVFAFLWISSVFVRLALDLSVLAAFFASDAIKSSKLNKKHTQNNYRINVHNLWPIVVAHSNWICSVYAALKGISHYEALIELPRHFKELSGAFLNAQCAAFEATQTELHTSASAGDNESANQLALEFRSMMQTKRTKTFAPRLCVCQPLAEFSFIAQNGCWGLFAGNWFWGLSVLLGQVLWVEKVWRIMTSPSVGTLLEFTVDFTIYAELTALWSSRNK